MAATGNVKISELTKHPLNQIDGREMLPMSWSADGSSSYESYKVFLDDMATYTGTYLGVTGEGGTQDIVNSHEKHISYLERDLGQYEGGLDGNFCENHSQPVSVAVNNAYIYKNGSQGSASGWAISNPVSVKEGTLYLLKLNATEHVPDGYCLFAKRHVHTYYPIIGYEDKEVTIVRPDGTTETITVREPVYGEAQTEVVYEPRSFHYDDYATGGESYGIPKQKYVVFFAPEDEDIVCCANTADINNTTLYAVHYGVFSEIAEKFMGATSDLTQVISEAVAELEGRVEALEAGKDSLGDGEAHSLDVMTMPKYKGFPMVVISNHAPIATEYYVDEFGEYSATETPYRHPADLPNFEGQIWINSGVNAWISINNGVFTGWKQVSFS